MKKTLFLVLITLCLFGCYNKNEVEEKEANQEVNQEVEEKDYSSTLELLKQKCNSSYSELDYDNISRNPDKYDSACIHFKGEVVQVLEAGNGLAQLRVYTSMTDYEYIDNYYDDDAVMVFIYNYDNKNRILEDDIIEIYGVFNDLYTYETVLGSSLTIPSFIMLDYKLI